MAAASMEARINGGDGSQIDHGAVSEFLPYVRPDNQSLKGLVASQEIDFIQAKACQQLVYGAVQAEQVDHHACQDHPGKEMGQVNHGLHRFSGI